MGDDEPKGEEAEAQREETVMPLVWMGLGLLVIVGFIVYLLTENPTGKPAHQVVVPAEGSDRTGSR